MKLLGVLGNPIAHSRSPEIHQAFASSCGFEISYRKIRVPTGEFEQTASDFLAEGALGFNVTVPNKTDAFRFVGVRSAAADLAGSVNTVVRQPDGSKMGHNTDGAGLVADIANIGWQIKGQKVLIIGAGGAVSGVVGSLLQQAPERLDICNRTFAKAEHLVGKLNDDRFHARRIDQLGGPYDLIISGSSAGLSGAADSRQLPAQVMTASTCCYDMIYGAARTPFLNHCAENGCVELSDGLGMLVEQAALAFNIWFNESVSGGPVISQIRNTL